MPPRRRRSSSPEPAAAPPGPPLDFVEAADGAWVRPAAADTHHLDAALFPKLFSVCSMVKDLSLTPRVSKTLDDVLYDRSVGVLTKVSRIAIVEYTMVCRGQRSRLQAKLWIPGRPDRLLTSSVAPVGAVTIEDNGDGTMAVQWSGVDGGSPAADVAAADTMLFHRVIRALDEARAAYIAPKAPE